MIGIWKWKKDMTLYGFVFLMKIFSEMNVVTVQNICVNIRLMAYMEKLKDIGIFLQSQKYQAINARIVSGGIQETSRNAKAKKIKSFHQVFCDPFH